MQSQRPYTCPRHGGVHRSRPGRCPQCDAALVQQGPSMTLLANPVHLALGALMLIAAMAISMLLNH